MGERRATRAAVARLAESLSERDRAILADVAKVRVLTSAQLGRLRFADLTGAHRDRTRRRVLERLASLDLLTTLERRIGGVRAGSAGLVFALGLAGQQLMAVEHTDQSNGRTRQPGAPTERFLRHTLAISELYVGLTEAAHLGQLNLDAFHGEPASWWHDSDGEWVKPDAYAVVSGGDAEDHWVIEVDMATESLPTLRRKLKIYVDLARDGERGPRSGPLPRVLVAVPHAARCMAVAEVIAMLQPPAQDLIVVTLQSEATDLVLSLLQE